MPAAEVTHGALGRERGRWLSEREREGERVRVKSGGRQTLGFSLSIFGKIAKNSTNT